MRHWVAAPSNPRAIPAWRTFTQPISKRFLSGVITGLRHGNLAQKDTRVIPAPSPRHPRAIPVPSPPGKSVFGTATLVHRYLGGSPAWRSINQPISDRSLSDALIALRHGNPCPQVPQRHPSAIPALSQRHPRVTKRSSDRSLERPPRPQMPQWPPR